MKGECGPAQFDSVFQPQSVGTHGTEITPGSYVVEEDLYNRFSSHDLPSSSGRNIGGTMPIYYLQSDNIGFMSPAYLQNCERVKA